MKRTKRSVSLALLALAALVGLQACGSDGAKFFEGDRKIFAGTLEPEEASSRHDFLITETGLVEFHLEELTVTDPETGEAVNGGFIGLSIGRVDDSTAANLCRPSFSNFVQLGQKAQLHLQPVAYCIQVFRSSGIPEMSPVDYLITAYTRSAAP